METYLKIMGVNFHSDPIKWDQQFDTILNKAGKRMYILRVCKKYGGVFVGLPALSFPSPNYVTFNICHIG